MKVLLVEDDSLQADTLKQALVQDGHCVDLAEDGMAAGDLVKGGAYDVIVLDRMLPEKDGVTLVEELRSAGCATPVLMLSNLAEEDQRIEGLNAGSNDYVAKDVSTREFLARVRAIAHGRDKGGPVTALSVGDMDMDLLARTVHRGGKKIDLQPREFRLLEYLMRHAGQVVTRTMLLEKVWDYHFDPQTNVIDVHISRLRAKIDRDFSHPLLHTVRGEGYRLEP
jgi:two-component system OmpR family response regulator